MLLYSFSRITFFLSLIRKVKKMPRWAVATLYIVIDYFILDSYVCYHKGQICQDDL